MILYFNSNYTDIFPKGPVNNGIGLENDLAQNRRQAIIWTNDGIAHWRIYASFGQDAFWTTSIGFSFQQI